MSSPQDRFAGEPAPGSRDTGSDTPSGGEHRPSAAYRGDESVPQFSDPENPGFDTSMTNRPPQDVKPAMPPYEGRKTEGEPTPFTEKSSGKHRARD